MLNRSYILKLHDKIQSIHVFNLRFFKKELLPTSYFCRLFSQVTLYWFTIFRDSDKISKVCFSAPSASRVNESMSCEDDLDVPGRKLGYQGLVNGLLGYNPKEYPMHK